jgi:hypothetical protein
LAWFPGFSAGSKGVEFKISQMRLNIPQAILASVALKSNFTGVKWISIGWV